LLPTNARTEERNREKEFTSLVPFKSLTPAHCCHSIRAATSLIWIKCKITALVTFKRVTNKGNTTFLIYRIDFNKAYDSNLLGCDAM
jgi:hypothetical protein